MSKRFIDAPLRNKRRYHSIRITEPMMDKPTDPRPSARTRLWKAALLLTAAAYAWPVFWSAHERVQEVTRKQRQQLIVRHELWTLHPEYAGTPQTWTRFASLLLSDRQLLRRVRTKYGALGEQIELDYRRDLFIAQAEVVLVAAALWALPLVALYGVGMMVGARRRTVRAPEPERSPASDSRYRP
jgi:hypothetical protein